jgi:phosphoesterase RecJ-like protein
MITTPWNEATAAVETAASILIVTHVSPDGDAIGSLLGLANALRERGKTVAAAVDGGVPPVYMYLQNAADVASKLESGAWDLMISVDASDEARSGQCGAYGRANSKRVINLDHHETNTGFGDIQLILPKAVSATEVIFLWLKQMQHPLSPEVATALLTGIVTDTMCFRTTHTTPESLSVARELMEAGAPLYEITQRTLDTKSYTAISLWKRALKSMKLADGVISAVVKQADLRAVSLNDTTDAGMVGVLISVAEACVAVVFKETPEGRVELSMRSKLGYDVAQVALALGGGGHKQAAGATIDGPLKDAKERVLPMLQAVVKNGRTGSSS